MSDEQIEEINETHPFNLLIDMVEDDEFTMMRIKEQFDRNGLKNRREFNNALEYQAAVLQDPTVKPNICIFDYLYDDKIMTGLDLTIMTMKDNEACKVIMITGYREFNTLNSFYYAGGYRWVDKDVANFQNVLTDVVQAAIVFIKKELWKQYRLEQIEVPQLRKDRKPLSANEKLE